MKSFFSSVFMSIRKRWKLSLVVILVLAGLGFWQYTRIQAAKPKYVTQNPVVQKITKTLDVSGVVDAKEKARMRFLAGGKVTYIGAKEGDSVKKGQTIATIDQSTLKKQLEQDLNTYLQERNDWDQTLDNTKDRWLPKSEERSVNSSGLDLRNEVLDVEIRDIAIQNTRLSAPFAGVLTVSPTAVTGVPLISTDYFEIVNPETLLFRGNVDEADISLVKKGQMATLDLDAYQDQTFQTTVEYVSFVSAQSTTGTVFTVEFPLTPKDVSLFRLGMNGDISIILEEKDNALTIPLAATRERDGKVFVDIKTGTDTIAEREITVGLQTDELVEVTAGLSQSDQVVIPQ